MKAHQLAHELAHQVEKKWLERIGEGNLNISASAAAWGQLRELIAAAIMIAVNREREQMLREVSRFIPTGSDIVEEIRQNQF